MTITASTQTTLKLFSRWTNAREDLYMYVSNMTESTCYLILSDNEGSAAYNLNVGDHIHLDDGRWRLVKVNVDNLKLHPWDPAREPSAVFEKL